MTDTKQDPVDDEVTQNCVREHFWYDPLSGRLFWKKVSKGSPAKAGDEAGTLCGGYKVVGFRGKNRKCHRIIWLYVYGNWPKNQIDHINGNRSDNRIENLRDVRQNQNMQNKTRASKNIKSGLMGAYFNPNSAINPWESSIKVNKKRIYLGRFQSAEAAHDAYIAAKSRLHDAPAIASAKEQS